MNAPKTQSPRVVRAASLALSVLLTVLIFGSVALGLTWDAGSSSSLRMAGFSEFASVWPQRGCVVAYNDTSRGAT